MLPTFDISIKMIQVVDNFLPDLTFKSLQKTFLTSRNWAYCQGTVIESSENDLGNFFFTFDLTSNLAITNTLLKRINQEFLPEKSIQIQKCTINLTTFSHSNFQADAHIDYGAMHYVMILYMNETDGNTIIYDEQWNDSKPQIYNKNERDRLKVAKIISPKENRCVFFDGRYFHSYYFPQQHNRRLVINTNIIVQE